MSEAERIEVSEIAPGVDTPPETENAEASDVVPPEDEGALEAEAPFDTKSLSTEGAEPEAADGAAEEAAHGLSNATLESMSRTDPQAQAVAEAERTKWERRREIVRERVLSWCNQYMADGGFKLGVSLVTAVIAAAIIVIAGIFSDRMLSVVFWRAVVGFFVSGIFMGGSLYWLDRFGIPLFIAKHEDQIQMDWLAETEGTSVEEEEVPAEGEEEEPGELEELMPQGNGEAPQVDESAELLGEESAGAPENPPDDDALAEGEMPTEEGAQSLATESISGGNVDDLENAVLDDAFSSAGTEEEPGEPPTFSPMTADNLETLSVPKES